MCHDGRGKPARAHAVHELEEVIAMGEVKDGFEKKPNSQIDPNEVPDDIAVGFDPETHSAGRIHRLPFKGSRSVSCATLNCS